MRQLFCKSSFRGLILAALTAGTFTVPASSAQSGATQAATHPAAKKSTRPVSGKVSSRKKTKKVKGQAAPTPERISQIQEALAKRGAFTGTPTGKWDDSTVEAMKKFQSSNGLTSSGKLDALTLEKLGLGSETAGLAAPTPPPNSANRLRNQSSAPPDPSN